MNIYILFSKYLYSSIALTFNMKKMFCKKCGCELIAVDKSKDEQQVKLAKAMYENFGLNVSLIHHYHPKDKGCAINNGVKQ